MATYGFFFDNARCTGCRTCSLACRDYNDTPRELSFRKVYDVEGGSWEQAEDGTYTTNAFVYHISLGCQHCADPACVKACPTTAMHKDAETDLVVVDAEKCIGCGYCAMACPYGVPAVDREAGHSVKCTGCIDRVKVGKKPICVEACPLRALDFDEIGALRKAYSGVQQIHPMPDASITHPHLIIKASPAAAAATADGVFIANPKEVR